MFIGKKEDAILEKNQKVIADLCAQGNNELEKEYIELNHNYKRLLNKLNKITKINDLKDDSMNAKNISLQEDKTQIIKKSKDKILSTISNQREMKEQFSKEAMDDKKLIQELQKQLAKFQEQNITTVNKLDKTTTELKKKESKVQKLEEENQSLNMEVKALKELAIPIEEVLEKELEIVKEKGADFVLCMIGIDNYNNLKKDVLEFTTIENFILGILKYLKTSTKSSDTVVYFEAEMFFIFMPAHTIDTAKSACQVLGKRRTINQKYITLSAGITLLKEDDTTESIISRCLEVYNRAIKDSEHSRVFVAE